MPDVAKLDSSNFWIIFTAWLHVINDDIHIIYNVGTSVATTLDPFVN